MREVIKISNLTKVFNKTVAAVYVVLLRMSTR